MYVKIVHLYYLLLLCRLYIFDGFNAEVKISPYNGLFGEMKSKADTFTNVVSKDYLSHYQALTLVFSGSLSKRFYGFKAILTPVKSEYINCFWFICKINILHSNFLILLNFALSKVKLVLQALFNLVVICEARLWIVAFCIFSKLVCLSFIVTWFVL